MDIKPRHHAAHILKLETLEERRNYLNNYVPRQWRNWVEFYVKSWWSRRDKINATQKIPIRSHR